LHSRSDVSRTKIDLLKSLRYSKPIHGAIRCVTDVEDNIEGSIRRYDPDVPDICSDAQRFHGQVVEGLWME
jgi:hypothetical protein